MNRDRELQLNLNVQDALGVQDHYRYLLTRDYVILIGVSNFALSSVSSHCHHHLQALLLHIYPVPYIIQPVTGVLAPDRTMKLYWRTLQGVKIH